MKNKIKRLLTYAAAAVAAMACFACGDDKPHTHTYESAWTYNSEYHWHAASCGHDGKATDKSAHSLTVQEHREESCEQDGYMVYACVCGYTTREEYTAAGHTYGTEAWAHDGATHWRPALCGHDDAKGEQAYHSYTLGNRCLCGYEYQEMPAEWFAFERRGGGYAVTGFSAAAQEKTEIRLPAVYNGLPVTEIAEYAFAEQIELTGVILPSGIQSVGREAFRNCTELASVVLSAGLTHIRAAAFEGCAKLQNVLLPEGVTELGAYAFEGCAALANLSLPTTLSSLGEQAFAYCTALQCVSLPQGVQTIGANTFLGCAALSQVTLPDGITSVGNQAFARCTALQTVTLPDTVTFIGMNAFKGSGLTAIELPDSVEYLGAYAFRDCASLVSATLSKKIAYTTGDWFSGCGALRSLTLPFVGNHTSDGEAIETAFGFIFGTQPQNGDLFAATQQNGNTYYIPKTLTHVTVLSGTVSDNAFAGCDHIERITLTANVTETMLSFAGCSAQIERLS